MNERTTLRHQAEASVAYLETARERFHELVACSSDQLPKALAKLDDETLRAIVLERVVAARLTGDQAAER